MSQILTYNTTCVCARGRENVREYKKMSLWFWNRWQWPRICGAELFPASEKSSRHGSDESTQAAHVCAQGPVFSTDRCPVVNLKYYLSKLSPQSDVLFCKERSGEKFDPFVDRIWYTNKVHGVRAIGDFMKDISILLNLSQTYTNHSIRTNKHHHNVSKWSWSPANCAGFGAQKRKLHLELCPWQHCRTKEKDLWNPSWKS